jgi:hypothetical protein
VNVQLIAVGKLQPVSGRSCLDPFGSEPLPEGRDVAMERLLRSLRGARTPYALHQIVDRHYLAHPKQQEREQRTLLRPLGREIHAIGVHLEPTEEPKLHS